ncbi:MAG TPA: hypothetical protein VI423_01795 [Paenisporosarcina sp.]|nr:hypothetical protein [Paenisporosarcina sp.]
MDDNLKNIIKLAYAHSSSEAEYFVGRFVADLHRGIDILHRESLIAEEQQLLSLARKYEHDADMRRNDINEIEWLLSNLRCGG